MGTSIELIDRTNGHLAPDAEDYELSLLDDYGARSERFGHGLDADAALAVESERGKALQRGESRRPDSNRGPLHYE